MRKLNIIIITLFLILGNNVNAQSRLVLNNNAFIVIDNSAFVVIDNPNPNALSTLGSGGNIISENELDRLKWNIGNATGTYQIPFTTTPVVQSGNGTKIPLSLDITTSGDPTGNVLFSTYETSTDMNTPWASDVTTMNSGTLNGADGSLFAIDRFWTIDADNYTTKPDVTLSFGYDDNNNELNGTNTISESNLVAQYFNSAIDIWEGLEGTSNTITNTVSPVFVRNSAFFKTWTLSDFTVPLPNHIFDFNAYRKDKDAVKLDWNLIGLAKCSSILIERRLENETAFTLVGEVDCNQSSFVDNNNTYQVSYYRIIVLNEDTPKDISKVKAVKGNTQEMYVKLYPNPTQSTSVLEIGADYKELSFRIFDSKGSLVTQKKYYNSVKYISLDELEKQSNGIYLIDIRIDNTKKQLRLVKQN